MATAKPKRAPAARAKKAAPEAAPAEEPPAAESAAAPAKGSKSVDFSSQIMVRCSPVLYAEFEALAKARGNTVAGLARHLIHRECLRNPEEIAQARIDFGLHTPVQGELIGK